MSYLQHVLCLHLLPYLSLMRVQVACQDYGGLTGKKQFCALVGWLKPSPEHFQGFAEDPIPLK